MASTTYICEVQAMYVVNSRALCHLDAFMHASALRCVHDLWDCDDLFLVCQNVKTTSPLPTAVSYVFHEPMSFRFNKASEKMSSIPLASGWVK